MIQQIKKISGTGKFLNSQPSVKDFGKYNLVFGNNGSGKTTLALIFQSLKGNNELLERKRSFDFSVAQEISIITNQLQNSEFYFAKNKWNQFLSDIEIFDVHFINENIYAGLEIQNTHKKNLFEIILGQNGISLKNEIATLKERIKNGNKVVREATKEIELIIESAYPALEYANLAADPEVEEKIKWKQQEIETAKNKEAITQKPLLTILPLLKMPYDATELTNVLQQSIDNISKDFLAAFNDHKNHLKMGDEAEEWIQKGVEVMEADACPFCKKQLDGSENIIAAYQQYFNKDYKVLLEKINHLEPTINAFNPEAVILDIENKISNNLLLIDFWKDFVTIPMELISILDKKENFIQAYQQIVELIDKKSKDPIQALPDSDLQTLDNQINSINDVLNSFNEKINLFNEGIESIKSTQAVDLPKLELELRQFLAIQKRDTPEITESCNNLITYSNGIEKLKVSMKDKQKELDISKNTVFVSFNKKVNHYLQIFAPYLQLKNLTSGYQGSSTDPAMKFGLYVSGNALNQKKGAVESTFKYSLSEGDKSALALSFFLSKLSLDTDLSKKIIVFDDPISSFDNNRKTVLLQELISLGKGAEQLFVLTHDRNLANDLVKKTKEETMELNCYKLGFDGKSAVIEGI